MYLGGWLPSTRRRGETFWLRKLRQIVYAVAISISIRGWRVCVRWARRRLGSVVRAETPPPVRLSSCLRAQAVGRGGTCGVIPRVREPARCAATTNPCTPTIRNNHAHPNRRIRCLSAQVFGCLFGGTFGLGSPYWRDQLGSTRGIEPRVLRCKVSRSAGARGGDPSCGVSPKLCRESGFLYLAFLKPA